MMANNLSPPETGYLFITASIALLTIGSYAVLFSALLPPSGIYILDALQRDTHYKYFALLIIPTTSYFVIANWVGWQYYRNS
ncbi:hypothetical protein EW146_g6784 [Bondarzewia mesenterica]|uniref:PIG-P domain-containing protein n=1 Tax=Bondarzewia mesenterica TaxID=1095465 RepID=A0A4S4LT87_9AGAM|nr:hypothetical protein EW146_g6784 [Bondarzewia mesenterica]